MADRKSSVCVHLLESLDGLEIVRFHEKNRRIEKAGSLPLSIDPNTRAIPDAAELRAAIRSLYSVHGIALSSPTTLVLPSLYTREFYLPGQFSDAETRQALISEAEQHFLFRRNEPQIHWTSLGEERLLYSAYPRSAILEFVDAFAANRIPLRGIDVNYFALLRGLLATGTLSEINAHKARWLLMVISDHMFAAALFDGLQIKRFTESPLPMASMDAETAAVEINQDLRRFLGGESFEVAALINNAERLESGPLVDSFSYYQEIMIIDQNQRTLRSRNHAGGDYPCSLEAIGGAFYQQYDDQPALNLIPPDLGRDRTRRNLRQSLAPALVALNVLALTLIILTSVLLSAWNQGQQARLAAWRNAMPAALSSGGQDAPMAAMSQQMFVRNVALSNLSVNNLLVKAATLMPDDMWINRLSLAVERASRRQTVEIAGGALMPTSVSHYLNTLLTTLQRRDLLIDRADLATTADGQPYYDWTLRTKDASASVAADVAPQEP